MSCIALKFNLFLKEPSTTELAPIYERSEHFQDIPLKKRERKRAALELRGYGSIIFDLKTAVTMHLELSAPFPWISTPWNVTRETFTMTTTTKFIENMTLKKAIT